MSNAGPLLAVPVMRNIVPYQETFGPMPGFRAYRKSLPLAVFWDEGLAYRLTPDYRGQRVVRQPVPSYKQMCERRSQHA